MARIAQVWRFPVKSLGGAPVERARLGWRGLHADRLWAVRDLDDNSTATARRIPTLLLCSARYVAEPGPEAGPDRVPPVIVTLPDGDELHSDDRRLAARLSEVAGRRVALSPLTTRRRAHRLRPRQIMGSLSPDGIRRDLGLAPDDPLPDAAHFTVRELANLMRYSTPPRSFVDLAPVHVLTTASLAWLAERHGAPLDARRFRPTFLVETGDETGLVERSWLGADLVAGSALLRVNTPTIRCVVPSRPQPGLDLDRELGRSLSRHVDRYLGIYASVRGDGEIAVGDEVTVRHPPRPGVLHRGRSLALATAKRTAMRVGQATVLR